MKKKFYRLTLFGIIAAVFMAAGSMWYYNTKSTTALTLIMLTPAASVLVTRLLTGEGFSNMYLWLRLKKN